MTEIENFEEQEKAEDQLANALRKFYSNAEKKASDEEIENAVRMTSRKTGTEGLKSATIVLTELSDKLNPQNPKSS